METTNKLVTLKDAFDKLREAGVVSTQKEFADLIGVHKSTMSSAMHGSESALTDSLVAKVTKALKDHTDGAPALNDEIEAIRTFANSDELRELLDEQRRIINEMVATIRRQSEVIVRLLDEMKEKKA